MNHSKSGLQQPRAQRALSAMLFALLALAPVFSAHAAVSIDQSPLIIQNPLPPNIVLMLDDSGSMGWDFMPDINYINNNNNNDALIDASNNYVYYDPKRTYTPPIKADGTSYPNATGLTSAWLNGFNTAQGSVDLTNYNGNQDTGWVNYSAPGPTKTTTYNNVSYNQCVDYYNSTPNVTGGNYNSKKDICTIYSTDGGAFQYSVGPAAGPYVVHYVANTNCGSLTNCLLASDTSGTSAPAGIAAGQNIANWFAYSHTRILMAKTGLMGAFYALDPKFRLGFGSINGRNTGGLPSPTFAFATSTNSSNALAEVAPFGNGAAGTQKADFWSWLVGEQPGNSTPLRGALDAVGKYYQSAQPWQTSNTDTNAYACRQSYAILTTDGFWNGGTPSNIGNQDGTAGNTNLGSKAYTVAPPYEDSRSDTLADVAMKYWKTDLRTGLANEVPTSLNDPANWQHMVTFTVGLGFDPTGITPATITIPQIFSWAQTGNPPAGVTSSNFSWPAPSSNSINNIADMVHAGVNGHGAFNSAKSPEQFKDAIDGALNAAQSGPGSSNSVTLSGTQTPTAGSSNSLMQYRATFFTGQWTGTLTGDKYDPTTQTFVQQWDAGAQLPSASARNIWTSKLSSGTNVPVEFKLAANLSTAEQAGLDYYLNGVKQPGVLDQSVLDYLRGDNTYVQGTPSGVFRFRKAPLGDIVSSTPVLIDAPNPTLFEGGVFPGSTTYSSFATTEKNRLPLLYVAGNDGMLHAFRVTQGYLSDGVTPDTSAMPGREVYAYLPAAVLRQTGDGRISNLANPQYGVVNGLTKAQAVPHQYYNDGRITTQNVYFSSDNSWHTILVGTTGRGPAKAIYALDITKPSELADPTKSGAKLLWERSADDGISAGDAYIGEMTGAPVIAQIKVGGTNSWAVFIGNGYNSAKNQAALLQFDLKTGALTVHTTDATTDNGLAEPGLMQPDIHTGLSTLAFAGDLYGNIWKFDLSSTTAPGTKIFQAKDSGGTTQPVTSLVALTFDAKTKSTWALFGTGKFLTTSDVQSTQVQTWYGLRVDVGGSSTGTTNAPVVQAGDTRTNMVQRSIVAEVAGLNGTTNRATSVQTSATDMEKKVGWYMDLSTQSGERIVNRTQFIGNLAAVSTLIPKASDLCNPYPGGAVMLVDPYTGANSNAILGDFNGDGAINSGDAATVAGKLVPFNGKVFPVGPAAGVTGSYDANGKTVSLSFNKLDGSQDSLGPLNIPGDTPGRISWRELIN